MILLDQSEASIQWSGLWGLRNVNAAQGRDLNISIEMWRVRADVNQFLLLLVAGAKPQCHIALDSWIIEVECG